ncbi:MAG: hypothetical protein CSA65_00545 [Proteobacteria bacterium]|nr:MAG: hypothetical protein CSB49_00105 [Pseudomonadota bacterium]PIE19964.1 MAG: hypothetical protein CSA65_00545 [Pseudomonadota bacterium]
MRHRSLHLLAPLSLLTATLVGACGKTDDPGFVYQNQIFRDTELISAAKSGSDATPAFSWQALGEKHVALAIFSEPIQVAQARIVNSDKVVWLWHSGLGKGREGNVLFEQGAKDEAGTPPPTKLAPGTYYWAVWALDEGGHPIASSVENTLTVP